MKLTADIIFDELKRRHSVRMCGTKLREPHLEHVRMYCREDNIRENYVYITKSEWLPFHPFFPRNALLIVIGEDQRLEANCSCCTLFIDEKHTQANAVINEISDIFEKFVPIRLCVPGQANDLTSQ